MQQKHDKCLGDSYGSVMYTPDIGSTAGICKFNIHIRHTLGPKNFGLKYFGENTFGENNFGDISPNFGVNFGEIAKKFGENYFFGENSKI